MHWVFFFSRHGHHTYSGKDDSSFGVLKDVCVTIFNACLTDWGWRSLSCLGMQTVVCREYGAFVLRCFAGSGFR